MSESEPIKSTPASADENVSWSAGLSSATPAAPTVIMKGGTTSSRYDQAIQEKEADAKRRRAYQDAVRRMIETDVAQGGGVGGFHEQKLVSAESPKLLFQYMNADGSVAQECVSEITVYPDPFGTLTDMMFTIVCPKCMERGLSMSECQVMVKNSHRKWELDERTRGVVLVDTPWGQQALHRAGTVTVQDTVRCSNFNCDWAVRIDNSKVWRA